MAIWKDNCGPTGCPINLNTAQDHKMRMDSGYLPLPRPRQLKTVSLSRSLRLSTIGRLSHSAWLSAQRCFTIERWRAYNLLNMRREAEQKGMSVTGRHRKRSDPRRRIVRPGSIDPELKSRWKCIRYQGSAHHKSKPTGGELAPSPRRGKSLCDGLRIIGLREATKLLRAGIARDMVSERRCAKGLPKCIWAVDDSGEVYEAVQGSPSHHYHGYRLDRNDAMRETVVKEWRRRDNT